MRRLAVMGLLVVAACADGGDGAFATAAPAPLVGVDGSTDGADRSCHVVLRDLARSGSGTWLETAGSSWVWQGSIEISEAAAGEGLVPSAMYRMLPGGAWSTVTAVPSSAPATPGFVRFGVRLSEGLPGPGWSGSALASARIEVVPYLALAGGGRLFDHNRHAGDLDNYQLAAPALAVTAASTVCGPPAGPTRARLVFAADFTEGREGVLAPGGEIALVYDGARLPTCRHERNGQPLYDITAHVVFEPGQQRRDVSVRDGAAVLAVPADARRVVTWFENTSASGCQAWDSNLGANYVFEPLAPPAWIGEAQTLISRSASSPCDGAIPATQGFAFDTWARQRAAFTSVCFQVYQPGLTDRDAPDLWQQLDARLHWRLVGAAGTTPWQATAVPLAGRVGNNARFALSLRELDPYRLYHCPEVAGTPTPDGSYASIGVEYYATVNGAELRPAAGAAFTGAFIDYLSDATRTAICAP